MKILVMGLEGATPESLFGDERLTNFRQLMEFGCYGRLESVLPPTSVPAWLCLATSQDPGSLGVYGPRSRAGYSYTGVQAVDSQRVREVTIWEQVARAGGRAIIVGVPPAFPPRSVNGLSVGWGLTPGPSEASYTYPASVQEEITALVGEYPLDVQVIRADGKDRLRDEIYATSRKQFQVVRHLLQNHAWDYFQFVEMGLDRIQRAFWQFHDPQHALYQAGNPYRDVVCDYYAYLDDELGRIFELLDEDTVLLALSVFGTQRRDGGFCVNQWLVEEGLLVLNQHPKVVTPFTRLDVNWGETKVWCAGGSCARVYFNVKGREPQGVVDPAGYEAFRDRIKEEFEAIVDDQGSPLGMSVFKPQEIYRKVRAAAPDLIVCPGGWRWQALDGVGYPELHIRESDGGQDECGSTPHGSFVLAAPYSPLQGEIEGARLLDIAPTLLELTGHDVPGSMQGQSLLVGRTADTTTETGLSADEEELLRERLSGLGYIS